MQKEAEQGSNGGDARNDVVEVVGARAADVAVRDGIALHEQIDPEQREKCGEKQDDAIRCGRTEGCGFELWHEPVQEAHQGREHQGAEETRSNGHRSCSTRGLATDEKALRRSSRSFWPPTHISAAIATIAKSV